VPELDPIRSPLEGRIVRLEPLSERHRAALLPLALGDRTTFADGHAPAKPPTVG
jgi:hypothetical protein